jgi:hypothetical protein
LLVPWGQIHPVLQTLAGQPVAKVIRREETAVVSLLDATTNLCIVEAIRRAVEQGTTQTIQPLVA